MSSCVTMKRQDHNVGKGAPVMTKMAVPIAEEAIHNHTEIELCPKSVEHGVAVDTWGAKHGVVDLEQAHLGGFMVKSTTG